MSNIISQIREAKRRAARVKIFENAKKICLTAAEYDELIKPLITERRRMAAIEKAIKDFDEQEKGRTARRTEKMKEDEINE